MGCSSSGGGGGSSCGCSLLGSLATRALAPPSGRPVRKQEAGAACALLVFSPAALGPVLRGCCSTRRFAGGQLLSAPPARSSTRPPPQPRPVASTPPALSRPVSSLAAAAAAPAPMALCNGDSKVSLWRGGSLPHRFRTEARLRGCGATARGPSPPPPPSPPAEPCGPGSGASESLQSGPVACFLLGSGRCFVDFCLRVGVPAPAELLASGRASASRGRAAGPSLPRVAVGLRARGARSEGGGREASGRLCVCV